MIPRRFWQIVAAMGAFGAAAYLARSFVTPAEPQPAPRSPRKRPARASRTSHAGDDARRNGHGRAH